MTINANDHQNTVVVMGNKESTFPGLTEEVIGAHIVHLEEGSNAISAIEKMSPRPRLIISDAKRAVELVEKKPLNLGVKGGSEVFFDRSQAFPDIPHMIIDPNIDSSHYTQDVLLATTAAKKGGLSFVKVEGALSMINELVQRVDTPRVVVSFDAKDVGSSSPVALSAPLER